MNEIANPIFIFIAITLTFIASYTSLDLLTLMKFSERNRKFLFSGGAFTMGIGIWIMNFFGALSIDMNQLHHYNMFLIVMSVAVGILFTAAAFYFISRQNITLLKIFTGSTLMTLATVLVYLTMMYGMHMSMKHEIVIFMISVLIIWVAFSFSFWVLLYSGENRIWLKPISALVIAGSIMESYFLFVKSSTLYIDGIPGTSRTSYESLLIYVTVSVSLLVLANLIGTSVIVSKRLAASDTNLTDIKDALNESSIVAMTDPKGTITYINDKFIEVSKYTEKELIGQNHSILNSGYHSKEFFRNLWKTIGQGEVWRGEIQNRAKDGTYYWVDTTIIPFLNTKGKPYQYVSIRTDITNRKIAENLLKETLKELSDIKFALDQSSIVAFTNEKGIITSVNDKFCEISKYSREEVVGQDHRILNSSYHPKSFFKEMWRTIGQGQVWKGEIKNKAKDGTYYWVDTTIVPFLNEDGKPYQYLAIRNDITERKDTEALLRVQDKLAAVGKMAAGIAHEIRNPLTSMKGYAEFLQLDEESEERREYLDIILDEVDRVNSIVEDFLVLAKPKMVQLKEQNIVPVIQNVVSLLEFEARKKNVRIHFHSDQELIQVECDEDRLKQVFLNFIKNGIEAMPSGGDIFVKTLVEDNQVQISIQDTGVGIPEDKLAKIGEPFFTTKKNGNGLGLMVSFKIIENHHGKVYVESELNKGTTFSIVLPNKTA